MFEQLKNILTEQQMTKLELLMEPPRGRGGPGGSEQRNQGRMLIDERTATRPTLAAWLRRQIKSYALTRRAMLGGIGGLGGLTLLGCSGGSGSGTTGATTGTTTGTTT